MEIFVGVSGASGAIYAQRMLMKLLDHDVLVHAAFSRSAATVIRRELQISIDPNKPNLLPLLGEDAGRVRAWPINYFDCPPATGSHHFDGYVIVPCSTGMLGRIASGASSCLISRAADVALKERRRLVVVPREAPLSEIHLENMLRLTRAGATIMPASPGFYNGNADVAALVDFVIDRCLVQLGVTRAGQYVGEETELGA